MTEVISLKLEDVPDAIFLDEKVYVYSRLFNKRTCLNTLPKNDALRLYATMLIHAYTCLYMLIHESIGSNEYETYIIKDCDEALSFYLKIKKQRKET